MIGKFFVKTLGCRLNQAESQELEELLYHFGWEKTNDIREAGLLILNSCVVTRKAEKETRQTISRLRKTNPKAKLVITGCWVDKINQFGGLSPKGIDLMIGNQGKWGALTGKLKINQSASGQNYPPASPDKSGSASGGRGNSKIKSWRDSRGRALIKIQSGCSNSCSYCLARLVRGRPTSIVAEGVVKKINQAIKQGAIDIVLTGQNISQYDSNGYDWIDLLEIILRKTKVKSLRLGSINPSLVEVSKTDAYRVYLRKLINLYQGVGKDKLARHLHLSLQSGSDRILRLMNRRYTTDQFGKVVNILRREIKGINITTDIIVGFPGETEKDFRKTISFLKRIKPGKIHIFRYSSRVNTQAAKMGKEWGLVSEQTKRIRAEKLAKVERKLRFGFWRNQIGQKAIAAIWRNGHGLSDNYIPLTPNNGKDKELPKIIEVRLVGIQDNFVIASKL